MNNKTVSFKMMTSLLSYYQPEYWPLLNSLQELGSILPRLIIPPGSMTLEVIPPTVR